MKKKPGVGLTDNDELEIPPLSRDALKRGVMGKYYREVMTESNVVRIAADLNSAFPNETSVNRALRELLRIREALTELTSDRRRKSA